MPAESRTNLFTSRLSSSTQRQCSSLSNFSYPASQPVGQPAYFFQLVGHAQKQLTQTAHNMDTLFTLLICVNQWQGECNVDPNVCTSCRLLNACGSRLTEKLLEGAPTEDTLVLIERQTGKGPVLVRCAQIYPENNPDIGYRTYI